MRRLALPLVLVALAAWATPTVAQYGGYAPPPAYDDEDDDDDEAPPPRYAPPPRAYRGGGAAVCATTRGNCPVDYAVRPGAPCSCYLGHLGEVAGRTR